MALDLRRVFDNAFRSQRYAPRLEIEFAQLALERRIRNRIEFTKPLPVLLRRRELSDLSM